MKILLAASFLIILVSCSQSPEFSYEDTSSFVSVAAVDPKKAAHVIKLLDDNGIPNIVEGSVVYGVSVPSEKKNEAIRLLKADAEEHSYFLEL